MIPRSGQDAIASDTISTADGDGIATPATTPHDLQTPRLDTAPWPGSIYIITEKGTDKAITIATSGIYLQEITVDQYANNNWLCVEKNNYLGFYNPKSAVYLGRDRNKGIRGKAKSFGVWELMQPRRHPDGGYQLLLPHWWYAMMMITTMGDGRKLARTRHGTTLWEFEKVNAPRC